MKRTIAILSLSAALAAAAALAHAQDKEFVWKDGQWVPRAAPEPGTPEGELAMIRLQIDRGNPKKAAKAARKFLDHYPAHALCEEALGLAGDAHMARGHYWKAYQTYEEQLQAYPDGPLADRAIGREMQIAEAFLAGRKRRLAGTIKIPAADDGLNILETIAQRTAGTDRAQQALIAIADYYFREGKWTKAAESYDNFVKLFPKSSRSAHAELHAAEAFHRSYRGPSWDETPLIEAEQRYKAFAAHHPEKAREARVEAVLHEIRSRRAAKQIEVGRYYLRTGHPKSAARYFRVVVDEYGDTDYARQAEAELLQIDPLAAPALPAVTPPAEAPPDTPPTPPTPETPARPGEEPPAPPPDVPTTRPTADEADEEAKP